MQVYDLVMAAVLTGAILFGLWKGLAWQVASLAAIVVSYFVAMEFRSPVSQLINTEAPWNTFIAMFILFMGTSLAVWIGFGFVKRWIERWHLKTFDRQAGALLGAVKGALLCTLITLFAVSLLGEKTCESICNSQSGGYIARALTRVGGIVPPELAAVVDPYIQRFQQAMEEHDADADSENQLDPFGLRSTDANPWQNQMGAPDGSHIRVGNLHANPESPAPDNMYIGETLRWPAPGTDGTQWEWLPQNLQEVAGKLIEGALDRVNK